MELKVEQHSTDVLHVEVPKYISGDVLVGLLSSIDSRHLSSRLKDGITISADGLDDVLDSDYLNELPDITEFLNAVKAECEGTAFTPDEYFFHRWE